MKSNTDGCDSYPFMLGLILDQYITQTNKSQNCGIYPHFLNDFYAHFEDNQ